MPLQLVPLGSSACLAVGSLLVSRPFSDNHPKNSLKRIVSLSWAYVIWFYFQDIIISQESDWLDSERKEYAAEYTQL